MFALEAKTAQTIEVFLETVKDVVVNLQQYVSNDGCPCCNSACIGDCVNGCYSSCQGDGRNYG